MHQHPPPARRRPDDVRVEHGALEPGTVRREDPNVSPVYACWYTALHAGVVSWPLHAEPNVESSADIDVGKMARDQPKEFEKIAISKSLQSLEQSSAHVLYPKLRKYGQMF